MIKKAALLFQRTAFVIDYVYSHAAQIPGQ